VEQGRRVFDNLNKFIRHVIIELVAYVITFLGASILNIAAGQHRHEKTDETRGGQQALCQDRRIAGPRFEGPQAGSLFVHAERDAEPGVDWPDRVPDVIIVAAFQARSVTATAFTVETFDNRNLNWTALVELVLAVLIAHWEVLRRLFGTVELTLTQWALALVPAVLLFFIWELGKLIARRTATSNRDQSFFSAIFPPAIPCPRPPYVPPAPE
jgi:Ca2+-transporting ATPase